MIFRITAHHTLVQQVNEKGQNLTHATPINLD